MDSCHSAPHSPPRPYHCENIGPHYFSVARSKVVDIAQQQPVGLRVETLEAVHMLGRVSAAEYFQGAFGQKAASERY